MVSSQRTLRNVSAALGLFALIVVLPGCPFSPDSKGNDGGDTRIPPRNTVSGAIQQYAYIWENKLLPEYEALLHDDFEYFPQSTDVSDFPWLNGDSWARTEEVGMARNMFDKDFVGTNGNSIDTISMTITELGQQPGQNGEVIVQAHAVAQVLWSENSGAQSDVRFEFTVVPDPDEPGLFQIKAQRELPLL